MMHGHTNLKFGMIYLLTAIWLTPGGNSTVHSYTQTTHRTTQSTQNNTEINITGPNCCSQKTPSETLSRTYMCFLLLGGYRWLLAFG